MGGPLSLVTPARRGAPLLVCLAALPFGAHAGPPAYWPPSTPPPPTTTIPVWNALCCPGTKFSYHKVTVTIVMSGEAWVMNGATSFDSVSGQFKSNLAALCNSDPGRRSVSVDASDIFLGVTPSDPAGSFTIAAEVYVSKIPDVEDVRSVLAKQYREFGCGSAFGCGSVDDTNQLSRYTTALSVGGLAGTSVTAIVNQPAIVGPVLMFADPHLTLPHGGRADFRGVDGGLFNMLSAPNVSLNVKTNDATFVLAQRPKGHEKGGRRVNVTVHGSFLTESYITARSAKGHFLNVSLNASRLACADCATDGDIYRRWASLQDEACTVACTLKREPTKTFWRRAVKPWNDLRVTHRCDELTFELAWNTLTVRTPEYQINVTVRPVFNRLEGPHSRLDLQLALTKPESSLSAPPHGIIAQSWDGDDLPIVGKLDVYPRPELNADMSAPTGVEFRTSAMAEGAIEGDASHYRVAAPFATDFRYSRFDAKPGTPPRNLTGLNLPGPRAAANGTAGAGEELPAEGASPMEQKAETASSAAVEHLASAVEHLASAVERMPDIALRARTEQLKQQTRPPVTLLDPIKTFAPKAIAQAVAAGRRARNLQRAVGSSDQVQDELSTEL